MEREGVVAAVGRIVRSIVRARDIGAEREVPGPVNGKGSIHHVIALAVRDDVAAA